MDLPKWAESVVQLHSLFDEKGIEVECGYNHEKERVEAVCKDMPPHTPFPVPSWWVDKDHFLRGIVENNLKAQANHIEEFLNGN